MNESPALTEYRRKVTCICGNKWTEMTLLRGANKTITVCVCAFPAGEQEDDPDDSIDRHTREHVYEIDRMGR